MGTVFTRRFEADRIGSQVPIKLMHLEGLYELFVSKFAYTAVDWSMHHFEVHFKLKLTYRTPTYDDEDESQEPNIDDGGSSENIETETHGKTQWDDDCPWSKWYSAEDLVKGFELLALWSEITAQSSLDMAELENASPLEADKWFLYPCLSENLAISDGRTIGFASQLHNLVKALEMSSEAKFIEDFVSVENSGSENLKSSAVVPPPTVLDRVLKDLFHEVSETQPDSSLSEHKSSRSIKGAPVESLFAQLCLHALWFGNCSIRGIPIDNLVFNCCTLDRVCSRGSLVLGRITAITKNANQWHNRPIHLFDKSETAHVILQYYESIKRHPVALAVCIDKKRREVKGQNFGTNDPLTSPAQEDLQVPMEFSASHGVREGFGRKHDRNGSSGVAGSMMLLKAHKIMHAPITQSSSGQLERDILASERGGDATAPNLGDDVAGHPLFWIWAMPCRPNLEPATRRCPDPETGGDGDAIAPGFGRRNVAQMQRHGATATVAP
ncbi:UNVERIFIED_CONTAM: hypothetical protein Slati_1184200 [Sesamum latifolium]|uniref:Uncharacterized protein n=1 Tax=Sesamum latifolium TaxID=2727402 RepID=A0AAW2XE70_9LAMI